MCRPSRRLLGARTLLGAKGIAARSDRTLLGAYMTHVTNSDLSRDLIRLVESEGPSRFQEASNYKCIASSNKCLTGSNNVC